MHDLFGIKRRSDEEKRKKFQRILDFVDPFIKPDNLGLRQIIRLLGGVTQRQAMAGLISSIDHSGPAMEPSVAWFCEARSVYPGGLNMFNLKKEVKKDNPHIKLRLGVDIVLPCPREHLKLSRALNWEHEGEKQGPWTKEKNHKVEWWLPVGIGWVHGGNHSITAGIASGEGFVTPYHVYDISAIYQYVKCDGVEFLATKTGAKLAAVENIEFAAIFEIGRKMVERGVTY